MTNEELNTALYKKMFAEQEKFEDWLLSQSPREILNHAYEYTMREDILLLPCWPLPRRWMISTISMRRWKPATWRKSGLALKIGQNR